MIGIDHREEPPELRITREQKIARVLLSQAPFNEAASVGFELPEDVAEIVRDRLYTIQNGKCAYCEFGIRLGGYPVDHHRPKAGARTIAWEELPSDEPPERKDAVPWMAWPLMPGDYGKEYWWLAWTWENLFFTCPDCNSPSNKGNYFPLRRGKARVREPPVDSMLAGLHRVDLAAEGPLLVDPAAVNPLDHIVFELDSIGEDNWKPVGLTTEGRWTILVLGLDGPTLRTKRRNHVRSVIKKNADFIAARDALRANESQNLQASFMRAVELLLSPETDFLALNYFVLDHEIPLADRTRHGLSLPRPGKLGEPTPRLLLPPRPELDGLDECLRLRILALGRRAESTRRMRDLIVDICQQRPSSAAELGQMLRRPNVDALTSDHLTPLCRETRPRLQHDVATGRYSAVG